MKLHIFNQIKLTFKLWKYWDSTILLFRYGWKDILPPTEIIVSDKLGLSFALSKKWEDIPPDVINHLKGFIKEWEEKNVKD